MGRLCIAALVAMALAAPAKSQEPISLTCTEAGGEEVGRSGVAYRGGCSPETERDFLSGYLVGRRVFSAEVYKQRSEREYLEASRHTRTAIDYHAEKASAALAVINDSQASETLQARARKELEVHREQILQIEEEHDWANDRSWDAHLHLEQIKEELDEWRKSEAHAFVLDLFSEAQRFVRIESAVEFCSDEPDTAFFFPRPYCEIQDGGVLVDVITGRVCATGPSRATLLRRGLWGNELGVEANFLHVFNVSQRAENGKNEGTGSFLTFFDEEGAFVGLRCPEPEEFE